MDFELSTYQKRILNEFKNSNDNLFISALAGASKTFMLTEISKLINTYSVFLAFNKVIQMELADRIKNPKFRTYTFNGLGYQILLRNSEEQGLPKITIDQYKTSNICRKIASSDIPEYKTYNWELKKECIDTLTTLYELCKSYLYDMEDYTQLKKLIDEHNLFQEEVKEPSELGKIISRIDTLNMYQFEHDGIISFSDQLYITVKKLKLKEWKVPGYLKFFNILIDEVQDVSALQQQLIFFIRRQNARIVACGDRMQCQPKGTKILLSNGTYKNIEDVQIGDCVTQYERREGRYYGYNPTNKNIIANYGIGEKHKFVTNELVSVNFSNGIRTEYTPNHKCFARFNEDKIQGAYILYLMYKKDTDYFRIGKVKIYSKSEKMFGLAARVRNEGFDKGWILNIYKSNNEAWINEQLYSLKYQIPQVIFQMEKVQHNMNDIDYIYNNIGGNIYERAKALLSEFHRDFNFPFYENSKGNFQARHLSKKHCFEIYACNLIQEYMDMLYFDGEKKSKTNSRYFDYKKKYENIETINHKYGEFEVYGITVPKHHMYIADGIVTFNCIYGFNGADQYAVDNFKRIYKMKELELPICYRCPKSHLRYVNKEFPNIGIQSAPFAKEGAIKIIDEEEIMDYVQVGDFILSRKNKNLCCIVLSLLEKGIPIYFKDAQFVEKIIKKVEKIEKKVNNIYELEDYIIREQQNSKDKLKNAVELFLDKGEEKAHQDMEKYNYSNEIVDLFDCILILLKNYLNKNKDKIHTIQKFINYIREMLNTTERKNAVVCSSIHQSKGSETNNVFVLNEAKPAIYNFMTPAQAQQEKNLSYVALTRAKENLYLVITPEEDEDNEYNYSKFISKSNQIIDEFDEDNEEAREYFDIELEDMLP